ncbi:MAG: LytTR family DNA-binding domain-containing protein [Bacteroidetes bacterium]|nr:LytTR family DNA-binding domain-containing protein [Bacteroidota bacterium]
MLNCIAVDDEPLALNLIENFVSKIPFLTLIRKCSRVSEAIEILQKEHIDLIFLDIEMPRISGIQFVKSMEKKPMVIFTTAYSIYAVEGFNLDAVDYLVKPIPFERFLKAANKAYKVHSHSVASVGIQGGEYDLSGNYVFVKTDYKNIKINLDDILYIEGLKEYLKIYAGGKPILTLLSLKAMEEKLPSAKFTRVHRSYIVSIKKIDYVQKNSVVIGEKRIPVGDSYKEKFFSKLRIDKP